MSAFHDALTRWAESYALEHQRNSSLRRGAEADGRFEALPALDAAEKAAGSRFDTEAARLGKEFKLEPAAFAEALRAVPEGAGHVLAARFTRAHSR
ncbi:MAG: hypothetical protein PW734_06355 [Verrucomicrobium sp.]|nr:hypothetical protein [Verrucomicrobium sp.]